MSSPDEYSMPHDEDAEKMVLGGMMLSTDAISEVIETGLKSTDFYSVAHEHIFDAIVSLYGSNMPTDAVAVTDYLRNRGLLQETKGPTYTHFLIGFVASPASSAYYASIILEHAQRRALISTGRKISELGYKPTEDVNGLLGEAQTLLDVTLENSTSDDTYQPFLDVMGATLDEIQANSNRPDGVYGVPTGFIDFDDLTGGLHPGQMIVVAARPGVGKSTLAIDIARAAALHAQKTTVFFSLEMSKTEIGMRIISAEATLPMGRLKKGDMNQGEWEQAVSVQQRLGGAPLFVDEAPNNTLVEVRSKCRKLKKQQGLELVVIDYLQLMTTGKKSESRQQEVSEISRSLKLLAKELEVPIIALSQLNRGAEQRTDKRPMVSDLRESGSIEQDADIVILLHREDMYDENTPRIGEADMIIGKHRGGPTCTIPLAFSGKYSRFNNMANV